jgi:hypothetical protein
MARSYTAAVQVDSVAPSGTLLRQLIAQVQTFMAEVDQYLLYQPLGNPGFVIDTNFDVKNATAIPYLNNGTLKTLSANTSFNTGTTKVITANKWGAALLSLDSAGTATLTYASGNAYDNEAGAVAALTVPAATHTVLGYVTILTGSGVTWTAGTDALQGGVGGTTATTTTYYNVINPNGLRWDRTNLLAQGDGATAVTA